VYLDLLRLGANRKAHGNACGLVYIKNDSLLNVFLEALGLDLDLIMSDW
jgi:hypothetical protein